MASLTTSFSYELISVLGRMMDHLIVSVIKRMYMWKYDLTNQCLPLFGSGTLSCDMLAAYTCVLVTGNRLLVDTGSIFLFLLMHRTTRLNLDPNKKLYSLSSAVWRKTTKKTFLLICPSSPKCVSALQSETDQCTVTWTDSVTTRLNLVLVFSSHCLLLFFKCCV